MWEIMCPESWGGVTFDIILCKSRFNHVLSGDTLRLVSSLDTDTALKVSQSVYCFTTSISHGVDNYFPNLWGTGISDAIFFLYTLLL